MQIPLNKTSRNAGFTLVEMVICFAVMALVIGGTLTAYTNSSKFAERSGYQLAAQGQTVQMVERARAALWDTGTIPITDWVPTNVTTVSILDLPVSGTNVIWCTNVMTVTTITSNNPTWYYKKIRVVSTWPWNGVTASNVMVVYRSPDQ